MDEDTVLGCEEEGGEGKCEGWGMHCDWLVPGVWVVGDND